MNVRTLLSKLSPGGTSESSPGRSPGLKTKQTGQSRKGRLKAVYEIQPSLAGLIPIAEANPALRAGLLSDVPPGLSAEFSRRLFSPRGSTKSAVTVR
jgi:hypothetical protein